MAVDLQRAQRITVNLNGFPHLRHMLQILHQQTGNGVILTFIIQRQRNVLHQVLQRHMAVDRPRTVLMMLNIVPGIDLLHLIGQIAGDGLHHVAEGHNPLDGTKLIDHKGKMGAGLAELLERREERQALREDQRLTDQRL